MLRLATDENFKASILAGLSRQEPQLDIVRVQDFGLASASDPQVLQWAARERRVVVSHDRKTMPPFAYDMIRNNILMYGVVIASARMPIAEAIDEILLLALCSNESEFVGRVIQLPL
ncbi:MAG: DUF5615 family PIN-like protein [Pirellulales bacterium]